MQLDRSKMAPAAAEQGEFLSSGSSCKHGGLKRTSDWELLVPWPYCVWRCRECWVSPLSDSTHPLSPEQWKRNDCRSGCFESVLPYQAYAQRDFIAHLGQTVVVFTLQHMYCTKYVLPLNPGIVWHACHPGFECFASCRLSHGGPAAARPACDHLFELSGL